MHGVDLGTRIELEHPADLRRTLALVGHGRADPTISYGSDGIWRATRTPDGPATIHLAVERDGRTLNAHTWGPGASWLLERAPAMCGALDSLDGFEPARHPAVARLAHRMPGMRLCRTERVLDALVPAILEQKVTGREARRAWARLVRRFGEPAPGPVERHLFVAPSPSRLRTITSATWHRLGVERKRAETVHRVATVAHRLEETSDGAELRRRLLTVPGVGPWTAAEVAIVALGDPDAVSVGDYHLPHAVTWTLAGEPRGDDARMLELLAPFAGHRGRVVRLIEAGGGMAPRRGPRMPLRQIQTH
jgi:3-methyladenine DNA glycosylase/8-oxoguanine DNA glycosylase